MKLERRVLPRRSLNFKAIDKVNMAMIGPTGFEESGRVGTHRGFATLGPQRKQGLQPTFQDNRLRPAASTASSHSLRWTRAV